MELEAVELGVPDLASRALVRSEFGVGRVEERWWRERDWQTRIHKGRKKFVQKAAAALGAGQVNRLCCGRSRLQAARGGVRWPWYHAAHATT
jgi:hypothetical protein